MFFIQPYFVNDDGEEIKGELKKLPTVKTDGRNKTIEMTQGLNGHECLILGNHDNENEEFYMDCGFIIDSKYIIYNISYKCAIGEDMHIKARKAVELLG